MEYGSLLTDSKWEIVKELAEKDQTPTDLANKTNTSLANISQQIRLLEAYGIVKKEKKTISYKPGKPKTIYSINKEINYIISTSKHTAEKKDLELDFFQKAMLKSCLYETSNNCYFIQKFFMTKDEVVKKCDGIGLVRSDDNKIELLLITKDIQGIREKYSNQTIENLEGKKKTIVCWTHNMEEMESGIQSKNNHFINLTKDLKPLLEKNGDINKILDLMKNK